MAQEQFMRKIFLILAITCVSGSLFAQSGNGIFSADKFGNSADHFMFQISSDQWLNAPDSISSRYRSNSRGFNAQVMLNKNFGANPKYSVAFGLGISNSNAFFKNSNIAIDGTTPKLNFQRLDTVNKFNKYKIATTFLEIPVEFRYSSKPKNPNKSVKIALGAKVGLLLNAHSKGKGLINKSGGELNDYTVKISDKSYFNTTRISATARVGYGNYSLFGAYSLTSVFKSNVAADIKTLQIGFCLSGL